jgi:gamma-F420-2:alpha-L-glutamate ligase
MTLQTPDNAAHSSFPVPMESPAAAAPALPQCETGLSCWILWSKSESALRAESQETEELHAAFQRRGVMTRIVAPEQVTIPIGPDRWESPRIRRQRHDVLPPDLLIPRMGAHTDPYAHAIIEMTASAGSYCLPSARGIAIAGNKFLTKIRLQAAGVPVPKAILVRDDEVDLEAIARDVGFPAVIKRLSGSQGEAVTRAADELELAEIMGFSRFPSGPQCLLIEEFVEAKATDVRVFVLGGKAIAAMQRSSAKGWKANISLGGTGMPLALDAELVSLSELVARRIGLEVAGVDLIHDANRGYLVIEVNSSPGWIGLQSAHPGLKVAERIVDHAMKSVSAKPRVSGVPSRGTSWRTQLPAGRADRSDVETGGDAVAVNQVI